MNRIRAFIQDPKFVKNVAVGSGVCISLIAVKQAALFINKVQDDDMMPHLQKGDIVISFKGVDHLKIKENIALVYEPIQKKYLFRRIKGIPNDFVEDYGSGVNIYIPQGTMYIESEVQTKEKKDRDILSSQIGKSNPYENVFYTSLVVGLPLVRIYPFNKIGYVHRGEIKKEQQ